MVRSPHRTSSIKTAQKESVILRTVSSLFHEASLESPSIDGLFVTRVALTPGKSVCYIYLYSAQGEEHFRKALEDLKIYKPSMRKALSQTLNGRYTPDIVFAFDEQMEKTLRIESLLDEAKEEVESHGDNVE